MFSKYFSDFTYIYSSTAIQTIKYTIMSTEFSYYILQLLLIPKNVLNSRKSTHRAKIFSSTVLFKIKYDPMLSAPTTSVSVTNYKRRQ